MSKLLEKVLNVLVVICMVFMVIGAVIVGGCENDNDDAEYHITAYRGVRIVEVYDADTVLCINCKNVQIIFDSTRTYLQYNHEFEMK